MDEHLPKRERRCLQQEVARLHAEGRSDYDLARLFGVSPGAINKVRLHALIGRKVARAIYRATGLNAENLALRFPLDPITGCMVCERRRFQRDSSTALTTVTLCPEHALETARALYQ